MDVIIEHVSKRYGDNQVLTDADFRIASGERVCLFGPSGCGKTTMLRILCGLEKPDDGKVILTDKTRFACHFQEDRLLPWYTVEENLTLITGSTDQSREWLRKMQLEGTGELFPDELSGGMRRRASLARALAHESDILVLDEPLRELDEATAQAVLHVVQESIAGRTLVLVTHDRQQAEILGCRMIAMPQ